MVYDDDRDEELLFGDQLSNGCNDNGLDSDELEAKAMSEQIELLESTKVKNNEAAVVEAEHEHSELNFNLIKNSKAFKSGLRKSARGRNGGTGDFADHEQIGYVLNKTNMAATTSQQARPYTPFRISEEDKDAWFTN